MDGLKAISLGFHQLWNNPTEEVLSSLECGIQGLTNEDAEERLNLFGRNELPVKKKVFVIFYLWVLTQDSKFFKFFSFMWNPLSWVMQAAAIMAIGLANGGNKPPDWQVFLGIISLLLINSTIGCVEENKARNAIAGVMACFAPKARVRRNGDWVEELDAALLVPGDIISIKPGDIIPADVHLLDGQPLEIDQYALTRQSKPVTKKPGDCVFSGSTCKTGEIQAVVVATGIRTFFAGHKHLVDTTNQVGQFQKVMTTVGKFCICVVVVGIVLEIIVIYAIQRLAYRLGINNILVLLIGGIPTSMPIVLSVTMAIGSHRLSQQGAITKRMTMIEELAKMDVLCCGKTEILTLNSLLVDGNLIKVLMYSRKIVIQMAARATPVGSADAVDVAIVGMLLGAHPARQGTQEVNYIPFDQANMRSTLTYTTKDSGPHGVSIGAPEQILGIANNRATVENEVRGWINDFAAKGFKVVAVAYQPHADAGPWYFIGLFPLYETPRLDSAATIMRAHDFGVNVKMITGDLLAKAVNTKLRLVMIGNMYLSSSLLGDNTNQNVTVRTVDDLIEEASGFAEVIPEHKHEIIKRLKGRKHICGVTGDGEKDAPALNEANIGISFVDAIDGATRTASDVVVTKPGLSAIIDAVGTSRVIFQRLKSYMIYTVSITIHIVFGFTLLALIWKFNFPPFMMLFIVLLNNCIVLTISRDMVEPSPVPCSLKQSEIFVTGILCGIILAGMTIIFYWAASNTYFSHAPVFLALFKAPGLLRETRNNFKKLASVVYLQVSIISQAHIFVTRSRSSSFVERPSILLVAVFVSAQLIATLVAVYADWSFAAIEGIGWGWAGVIWIYNLVVYVLLDITKCLTNRAMLRLWIVQNTLHGVGG